MKYLGIVSLGINWENRHDSASGTLSSIVKENEDSVKSTRTIIVPPNTQLEACSILFSASQEALPYTGQGAFSITGRDSNYVEEIIKQEGYSEADILYRNGTHVFLQIKGEFSSQFKIDTLLSSSQEKTFMYRFFSLIVNTPMRTKLFVHVIGDPEGCQTKQKVINQLQRLRTFHIERTNEINELEVELKTLLKE